MADHLLSEIAAGKKTRRDLFYTQFLSRVLSLISVVGEADTHQVISLPFSTTLHHLTIGWQNLNLLSHPYATLALQARQVRQW